MKVICIDDNNRPNEVPLTRWIKNGETYTITRIMAMTQQGKIAGVKIAEINNDDLFPWTYFRLNRFGITEEQLLAMIDISDVEFELIEKQAKAFGE